MVYKHSNRKVQLHDQQALSLVVSQYASVHIMLYSGTSIEGTPSQQREVSPLNRGVPLIYKDTKMIECFAIQGKSRASDRVWKKN